MEKVIELTKLEMQVLTFDYLTNSSKCCVSSEKLKLKEKEK